VALARTDVSEERIASIIRVEIISELGATLATEARCEEILVFFRNVGSYNSHTASHPRRRQSSISTSSTVDKYNNDFI
jgi:hypothetical protein